MRGILWRLLRSPVTKSAFQNQTLEREAILGPAFSEFNYAVLFFSEMLIL